MSFFSGGGGGGAVVGKALTTGKLWQGDSNLAAEKTLAEVADGRYFTEAEHLDSSAGAGDAGKPIKLDAGGHVDATMVNSGDVDHGSLAGLPDDDHTQYHNNTRGDARYPPLSLLSAGGDIPYASAASTWARLAKGTARQALLTNSGATAPEWGASMQSLLTAGGDTIYASAANTPARLAKGADEDLISYASGVPVTIARDELNILRSPLRITGSATEPGLPSGAGWGATGNIYVHPWAGEWIYLWDSSSSRWVPRQLTSVDGPSLVGLSASTMYDMWVYDNSGALGYEFTAWTSIAARATALAQTDGVWHKSGDQTRRWLGSFYMTAAGTTTHSKSASVICSAENRLLWECYKSDTTSHTYPTADTRIWRNEPTNSIKFVQPDVRPVPILCSAFSSRKTNTNNAIAYSGLWPHNSSGSQIDFILSSSNLATSGSELAQDGAIVEFPVGLNELKAGEFGGGSGTQTFVSIVIRAGVWI